MNPAPPPCANSHAGKSAGSTSVTKGEIDGQHHALRSVRLSRFNPLGDDFFKTMQRSFPGAPAEPQMRLDVTEDDKGYTVKAEIPGVKKEDIKVSVDGNQVSISAEVKQEKEEKEGSKVIRSERYFGSVARSFSLASDVDENGAKASYDNGVLVLTLPKRNGSGAKRVTVS